jgi:PIN like domain
MAAQAPVYFTDENTLGLGKLLRREGRDDVVYPGHEQLPEVPIGTPDLDWMPIIARQHLIVVTRDRRIRTRPAELRAYWEHGIRSLWIGAKQDLGPPQQVELFLAHEERLQREITKRGPGPWALAMSPSGVRPLNLREPDHGRKESRGG